MQKNKFLFVVLSCLLIASTVKAGGYLIYSNTVQVTSEDYVLTLDASNLNALRNEFINLTAVLNPIPKIGSLGTVSLYMNTTLIEAKVVNSGGIAIFSYNLTSPNHSIYNFNATYQVP